MKMSLPDTNICRRAKGEVPNSSPAILCACRIVCSDIPLRRSSVTKETSMRFSNVSAGLSRHLSGGVCKNGSYSRPDTAYPSSHRLILLVLARLKRATSLTIKRGLALDLCFVSVYALIVTSAAPLSPQIILPCSATKCAPMLTELVFTQEHPKTTTRTQPGG